MFLWLETVIHGKKSFIIYKSNERKLVAVGQLILCLFYESMIVFEFQINICFIYFSKDHYIYYYSPTFSWKNNLAVFGVWRILLGLVTFTSSKFVLFFDNFLYCLIDFDCFRSLNFDVFRLVCFLTAIVVVTEVEEG